MTIEDGFFFSDGSCLLNRRHEYGTLLVSLSCWFFFSISSDWMFSQDLVNACARLQLQLPSPFIAYIGVEILLLMEMLARCDIIHGDVKPDNFLIMQL